MSTFILLSILFEIILKFILFMITSYFFFLPCNIFKLIFLKFYPLTLNDAS